MSGLFKEAQQIWEAKDRLSKFDSRFNLYPMAEASNVHTRMISLRQQIPSRPQPATTDELFESELGRRLDSEVIMLDSFMRGARITLEDVIAVYGLDREDLSNLKPWLLANRKATLEAVDRLFASSKVENSERPLSVDIPSIRSQAEGFAANQVAAYHQKLGSLFEGLTSAGNFLYRVKAEASTTDRSYFNVDARRVALGISNICYEVEDGTIHLKERELLRLFGHEAMGHALQKVVTDNAKLPFFLGQSSSATIASEEAIAQYYQRVIFQDLHASPQTQRALRIADKFEDIYQEEMDTRQIDDYNRNLFHYGILVLADRGLGDPMAPEVAQRKIELLGEVSLMPGHAVSFVEGNRYNYDTQGNLNFSLLSELRYSSEAVKRALAAFSANGFHYDDRDHRSHIDMTFLTGYYSALGFAQKAQLASQGKL